MTIRNRELSQFGSFIYIENTTKDIGITTEATPYVGIGTTNATQKLDVNGNIRIHGDLYDQNNSIGNPQQVLITTGTGVSWSSMTDLPLGDAASLNGESGSYYTNASNINAGTIGDAYLPSTISSDITGNAGTATSLATARDFSITGDFVTAPTISFSGTSNVALAATITADSIVLGTYTSGDYVESVSGITSEIVITGGTGEGSTPTFGLSSNLVLPGNLEVNGISTFTSQLYAENVSSGIITASAYYIGGSLIVDPGLETWATASVDGPTSIYRNQGNVGIGTSTSLYKLSVNGIIESQAPQGTSPFVVRSTTEVTNLNVSYLRGKIPGGTNSGDIVNIDSSQTLTNKTINLTSNTLSGTLSQFNTALSDADFVSVTGTQTLTNKTLTSPIISQISNSGIQTVPTGTGTLISTNSVGIITSGTIANGTIENTKLANPTISGVSLGSNLASHIAGSYISGTFYNGSTEQTWNVDASSSNTPDTIVARDTNGDFTAGSITATDFTATSDISLKTNISTVDNAIEIINQLRGVSFEWKETNKKSYGVIAQELENILPDLVTSKDIKSVNYNGIIGILIEAIKELSAEVNELKRNN